MKKNGRRVERPCDLLAPADCMFRELPKKKTHVTWTLTARDAAATRAASSARPSSGSDGPDAHRHGQPGPRCLASRVPPPRERSPGATWKPPSRTARRGPPTWACPRPPSDAAWPGSSCATRARARAAPPGARRSQADGATDPAGSGGAGACGGPLGVPSRAPAVAWRRASQTSPFGLADVGFAASPELRRHRRRRRPRRLRRGAVRQHDLLREHRDGGGTGLCRGADQPLRPRRRGLQLPRRARRHRRRRRPRRLRRRALRQHDLLREHRDGSGPAFAAPQTQPLRPRRRGLLLPRPPSPTSTATATSTPSSGRRTATRLLPRTRARRAHRPLPRRSQPLRPGRRGRPAAAPALADIDGDGDLDAFVGEQGRQHDLLREHRRTRDRARLRAASTEPFGLADVGLHAAPAFADIDGDGDLDAFVGEQLRQHDLLREHRHGDRAGLRGRRRPTPSACRSWVSVPSPAFADIDGDGDLDAFIGEHAGNTSSSANTGDADRAGLRGRLDQPLRPGRRGRRCRAGLRRHRRRRRPRRLHRRGPSATRSSSRTPARRPRPPSRRLDQPLRPGERGHPSPRRPSPTSTATATSTPSSARRRQHALLREHGHGVAHRLCGAVDQPLRPRRRGRFARPGFADIDGDGDLDAFIGELRRQHALLPQHRQRRPHPPSRAASTNPFGLADVGSVPSPAFADIDGDGDLDASISGYRRTGSSSSRTSSSTPRPAWTASTTTPTAASTSPPTAACAEHRCDTSELSTLPVRQRRRRRRRRPDRLARRRHRRPAVPQPQRQPRGAVASAARLRHRPRAPPPHPPPLRWLRQEVAPKPRALPATEGPGARRRRS